MFTEAETKHLKGLAPQIVTLHEYTPHVETVFQTLSKRFKDHGMCGDFHLLGSCCHKIPFSDIDIYIAAPPEKMDFNREILTLLYGESNDEIGMHCWQTESGVYNVELLLTESDNPLFLQQCAFHHMLRNNPDMKQEYAQIKIAAAGRVLLPEYTAQKYKFWNQVLSEYNRMFPCNAVELDAT